MPIGQVTDVLPDPVLTGLAVELGKGGPGAADVIAPVLQVAKDEFKYAKFKREDIKDEDKSKAAPGQPAAEVTFGFTYVSDSVNSYKLKSRIADDVRANEPFNTIENRRTRVLTNKLRLGVERRIKDLCETAPKTKATPAIKWDAAGAKIRADMLSAKSVFRKQAGMAPNVVVIPPIVYDVVVNDTEIVELLKRQKDLVATEVIENILQMRVVVPGLIVDISNPGAAESISDIWASDEVYYLVVDGGAGDDLEALTALRQVRSLATGGQGLYIKRYRESDESAEADWVSAHLKQKELRVADELILRQLDVLA